MQQTGSENTQTHQFTTLIEQTPNSHNQFTRKCVIAREVNCQSDFGNERVNLSGKEKTLPTEPLMSLRCYRHHTVYGHRYLGLDSDLYDKINLDLYCYTPD